MTPLASAIHRAKYQRENETREQQVHRVASTLLPKDKRLEEMLWEQRFIFGGRVQRAIGVKDAPRLTPLNCFLSRTIEDSLDSILAAHGEAARTMAAGGGIGYDFSKLRPYGTPIRGIDSLARGPVGFLPLFDAVGKSVNSAGERYGAQMGVLRVDHPDIRRFIRAKQDNTSLTGFNLSVAVTDEFMKAVEAGGTFHLRWGGSVHETVEARELWDEILQSTYDFAEPGVIFIDTVNDDDPLSYVEDYEISATNPCGEKPMEPYGACLLGSFNLTAYLQHRETWGFEFNWRKFRADIPVAVEAMDRVIDVAKYPLREQWARHQRTRRLGIGVTGLANAGEAVAGLYGSEAFLQFTETVFRQLRQEAYAASVRLAGMTIGKKAAKGSFPLWDADKYLNTPWGLRLPGGVRRDARIFGLRNSHLLAVAPTGTMSLTVDKGPVSSGIEPVFRERYTRPIRFPDGKTEDHEIVDWGVTHGVSPKTAEFVTVEEHLDVMTAAQPFVCSSISKTVNVPKTYRFDEFQQVYWQAWQDGLKSCATFRDGGSRAGLLDTGDSCRIEDGKKICA